DVASMKAAGERLALYYLETSAEIGTPLDRSLIAASCLAQEYEEAKTALRATREAWFDALNDHLGDADLAMTVQLIGAGMYFNQCFGLSQEEGLDPVKIVLASLGVPEDSGTGCGRRSAETQASSPAYGCLISLEVVYLLQPVHRSVDAFVPGLELQGQVERVVPSLVEVAAHEPQVLLLGGLPHIALLALTRARVLGGLRPQTPALADLVRRLLVDEVSDPAVHRPVAGGVDD